MTKLLKIAKILDEYNVVINGGASHGIEAGDEFQILDKKGSSVKDPDTGETIGHLDLIKATVKVTDVQEKMCICTSNEYTMVSGSVFTGLNINAQSFLPQTEKEKLNVDNKQITGGLRKSNAAIRVGDAVKLIKSTEK